MNDKERPDGSPDANDDDIYTIEDTGESLKDYQVDDDSTPERQNTPATAEADLEEENRRLKDQYLRKLADFDNFRKRSEREKQEFFRYAMADVLRDLLPVLDNFERALATPDGGEDFRKGIELIYKQLSDVMQKAGVRTVDETGVHFDPTRHEAVIREENDEVPAHTVVDVLQKGYFLHDRLIRPAMVKVAVGGPERHEEEPVD